MPGFPIRDACQHIPIAARRAPRYLMRVGHHRDGSLPHRWSTGNNYLAGICLGDWLRLLADNRLRVSPAYWHRAAFITAASVMNSLHRLRERRHEAAIRATEVSPPPLFILGHWRSGTTLLHYLLARDTANFAFANTYQVSNPHGFLSSEAFNARLFAGLVPPQRVMDAMAQGFDTPQEDEFAPCLTTLLSPYLGISFPHREDHYGRFLTFAGVPRAAVERWREALHWFCRKLTLKYGRRLVLKSPPHTARIRILLETFPGAKFVHIHRHPCDVFRSSRHYWDTAVWFTYLQRPDRSRVDDGIIARYRALHDAFWEHRPLIPPGDFCEVAFADLERDPAGQVKRIYQELGLAGFAAFEPALATYLDSLRGYRKNRFEPLPPALRQRLATAWRREFESWNYDCE